MGIVKNMTYGAIDGKCRTEKGETLYFRTIIKEIEGEVLWDEESFSNEVLSAYQATTHSRQNCVDVYSKKLKTFEDSLVIYYSSKYDTIYNSLLDEYNSLLRNYGSIGERYRINESDMNYFFYQMRNEINSAKNEIAGILFPIIMYENDFRTSNNCLESYMALCNNLLYEASIIDTNTTKTFIDREVFNAKLKSIETELIRRKTKQDSIDHERNIEDQIKTESKQIEDRILILLNNINNRDKNKKLKELKANATKDQLAFLNNHIHYASYKKIIEDLRIFRYNKHFYDDAINNQTDKKSRLDRLRI